MPDDFDVYDSTDDAAAEAARREAERRERDDNETIRIWMNHPHGRDLLYRIAFEICHLGQSFVALDEHGRSDTHRTYMDLGERNIGAWFDGRMRCYPDLYMKMLEEQRIDSESRDARLRKQNEKQEQTA